MKDKPKPVTLDFEKPLVDLEKKIIDVREMANDTGLDFSDQAISLENKYQQAAIHKFQSPDRLKLQSSSLQIAQASGRRICCQPSAHLSPDFCQPSGRRCSSLLAGSVQPSNRLSLLIGRRSRQICSLVAICSLSPDFAKLASFLFLLVGPPLQPSSRLFFSPDLLLAGSP